MYTLKNDALDVAILDPVADRERMGTRYCTGGYIFTVEDPRYGNLLSGPTYPESFNTYDGQGIPDAFNLSPLRGTGPDVEVQGPRALVLGIGECNLEENRVLEWCDWEVEAHQEQITMTTGHSFHGYEVAITRAVALLERTVRSTTRVENHGRRTFVPIRWFPHPFFPHPETDELCKFNIAVEFPENPGYEMGDNGFIRRKDWPWQRGYYQALDHEARAELVVIQKHPQLGQVTATCSYVPAFFPIWGNAHTFSWEPFFERSLAPGQAVSWYIDYDF